MIRKRVLAISTLLAFVVLSAVSAGAVLLARR